MPETLLLLLAGMIVVAAVAAIIRGYDVRLALGLASLSIAGLTGDVMPILREFLATFSNEKFVVPIATAMGFAYVLKHTECDLHLVHLLTKPLRYARFLLIPGVVLVGFLVNIPVISQTSTAVCIGAVVVPLMRAGRISNATIGATIVLGASLGGELLNPGAPELNTVGQRLGISSAKVIPHVLPLVSVHLVLAMLLFWFFSMRAERKAHVEHPPEASVVFRLNILRALVPLVPLVLLFLIGPPLNVFKVPERWVVVKPAETLAQVASSAAFLFDKKDTYYETRLIGAAMLFGVLVASLANPWKIRGVPKAFFDGAGYAFAEIISLIVVANGFGKAIELVGLAKLLGDAIATVPNLLIPMAGAVPLLFGFISGSGMAATQSLYSFFVDPATSTGADPTEIGAIVSLSAAAGRTMSPVAAVALMSAKLTGTSSFTLAKRVAPPLLISLVIVLTLRALGVLPTAG